MEVLAWNCRGMNNDRSVQALQTLIRQKKPEGQSGGVYLFWEDRLDIRFLSKSSNHIDVEVFAVDGSGIRWRLTGFYGYLVAADRHLSWDLLRELADHSSLPWVVIGDFNEIVLDSEKDGGVPRNATQKNRFQTALDDVELIDLGYFGAIFTWKEGDVKCRLDREVATPSWLDLFPASTVTHLPPIHGDHVPILLGVYETAPVSRERVKSHFRFESSWTVHEECKGVVEEGWLVPTQGLPMFQAMSKIASTRMALNSWQRTTFGNRKEVELMRGRLEELLNLPVTTVTPQISDK
ncbi:hypothetical protein ACLB2K_047182 [Fragaria x ananassa]